MLIVSIIILFPSFNTLCAVSIALFDRSNLKAENSKRIREGHHDTEITQKKISYKQQFVEYFDEICNQTARNASFISFARFLHLHMYL